MNTWPISIRRDPDRVYLGIPDSVGDGGSGPVPGVSPSLEEVAGEEWLAAVLRLLLPGDRAWAWCTQSSVYRRAGLPTRQAPALVDPNHLGAAVTRSRMFHATTLALVPGGSSDAQAAVIDWAGADTEQIPDHLWVAPAAAGSWDVDEILAWCEDPARWTNLASVAAACRTSVDSLRSSAVLRPARCGSGRRDLRPRATGDPMESDYHRRTDRRRVGHASIGARFARAPANGDRRRLVRLLRMSNAPSRCSGTAGPRYLDSFSTTTEP